MASQSAFATGGFNLHTQDEEHDDSAWAYVEHFRSSTLIHRRQVFVLDDT